MSAALTAVIGRVLRLDLHEKPWQPNFRVRGALLRGQCFKPGLRANPKLKRAALNW
jgi:hypothetical protein